jgi:hypothetical protein
VIGGLGHIDPGFGLQRPAERDGHPAAKRVGRRRTCGQG